MNATKPVAAAEKPLPTSSSASPASWTVAENDRATSRPAKFRLEAATDAETIPLALARVTARSLEELEGMVAELQEVKDFVKSEGDRMQREILKYTELNERALSAIKVISETIGPWKATAMDTDTQQPPGIGKSDEEKRTPAAPR